VRIGYQQATLTAEHPHAGGFTMPSDMTHGNLKRNGTCYVLMKSAEDILVNWYDLRRSQTENLWTPEEAMFTYDVVVRFLKYTALHESGHLLGLVSPNYLSGIPGWHNQNEHATPVGDEVPALVLYVMNKETSAADKFHGKNIPFKPFNAEYLEWILPKPQPQP
jgi:hypothetical protein